MLKRIFLLRRLLLSACLFFGLLVFWLPAHEVFEGPKTVGFLLAGSLLFALSLPLLPQALARPGLKPWLAAALALLGASFLSLLGAYALLPSNVLLSFEKLAPLAASALMALVFALESREERHRVLFSLMACHALVAFYGLIQVLDQTVGASAHLVIDLIRWSSFGESRVYSSLGNPDYMAAHLTLFLPLWLALPWRDRALNLRGALAAAAAALFVIPLAVLLFSYGPDLRLWSAVMRAYPLWALIAAALFLAARRLETRTLWLSFAYLLVALVILAQGRAAYLGLAISLGLSAVLAWRMQGKSLFERHKAFLKRNLAVAALALCVLGGAYILRAASPQNEVLGFMPIRSALKVSDSLLDRLGNVFNKNSDASAVRRFYYLAALRMGVEHPLVGVGFGNHALFTAHAQSEVWKAWEAKGDPKVMLVEPHVELYAHNDFLQNFAETGVLGLAAFIFFWSFFMLRAWRLRRLGWASPQGRLALGMLGMGAAYLTSAMLNFPWRVLATQQLCWLAFAWLAVDEDGEPAAAESAVHPGLLAAGLIAAFILALWPARWFFASSLFKQGNTARDQSRHADGATFYQKAVDAGLSGTQRVELYLYLGSMQNMLNRPDLAEAWFSKGVEIYPDFIEAYYNLGYTWMLRFNASHLESDRQKSMECFMRVLDVNPRYVNALNNLGNLHYAVRDYPKAAQAYEKLIRFAPQTLEARYNLGVTYLMMQKRPEGEAQLQEALRLKPGYPPALQLSEQLKRLPKGAPLRFQ